MGISQPIGMPEKGNNQPVSEIPVACAPHENQKILVVDDKRENLVALRQILRETGAEIIEALDGNSALASTLEQEFSLAILDVRMPGMSGYELAEYLHGDENTRLLPIIFLTASFPDKLSEFKGYEAGAIDYISKPFDPDILMGKVRLFLELDKHKREIRRHRDHLETLVAARTGELCERVKELKCLSSLSSLVVNPCESIGKMLETAITLIPTGWQYPDTACARISFEGTEYATENFRETEWMQSADIVFNNKAVGTVEVGYLEKYPDFDDGPFLKEERQLIEDIARQFGVVIQREKALESLLKIEWMLRTGTQHTTSENIPIPEYGNLVDLNNSRVIIDSVGEDMLKDIAMDYLNLLDTAAAIYEASGEYALGIFSSGWCRFLTQASRRLCNTDDNHEAIASGKWLCHESCWSNASKKCVKSGETIDIPCDGGLHIYAVPVYSNSNVVGSINFGYGDPPRDRETLSKIASKFKVDVDELAAKANSYESRPPYIIEMAKQRLQSSARLIGEIVNRKQAERERLKLEDELHQAQKMDAIGQLAGGVAHDFNNQLSAIIGYSELLQKITPSSGEGKKYISVIIKSAMRSADLTRQLLTFARKSEHQKVLTNIHKVIDEVVEVLKRTIDPRIEIKAMLTTSPGTVCGDPGLLQNAILNICINARDAMPEGGVISITTRFLTPDDSPKGFGSGSILISISDNGIGMDEETKLRMFEPFYTTKEVGKGTGMGLAAVYGTVKSHGGIIEVETLPGQGTTFLLYLPLCIPGDACSTLTADTEIIRGEGRILVVDDEDDVREMVRDMLESLGYTVVKSCHNGEEAAQEYKKHSDEIDLVLMDMLMPRMNGVDAFKEMLGYNPDVQALIMSGYGDGFSEKKYRKIGFAGIISKPFSRATISRIVAKAMKKSSV